MSTPNGVALVYVQAAPTPTPSPTPVPPGPSPSPTPQPSVDVEDPKPLPPVNPEEPLQSPDVLSILDPTAEQLTALYEISFSGANTQRFKLDERFADIQRGLKRIYRVHLKSSSSTTNFRQRSNRPRESSSAGISAHTPDFPLWKFVGWATFCASIYPRACRWIQRTSFISSIEYPFRLRRHFRTDLGLRASYPWHCGSILLIPSVTAAWEHEYSYSALPITVSSPLFPGQTQTFFGPSESHDSAVVNPLLDVQWTPRFSTFVG
jgi:hypothetical protein